MTEVGTACRGKLILGDNILDVRKDTITRDGIEIPMASQTLAVALVLARHAGEVVTRDELIDEIWGGNFLVGSKRVTDEIWRLRRALGDSSADPQYIKTVPRRGYRLVATPHWIEDEAPESSLVSGQQPSRRTTPTAIVAVVMVTLVAGLSLIALDRGRQIGELKARTIHQEQMLDSAVEFLTNVLSGTQGREGVDIHELLERAASLIPGYAGEPGLQIRLTQNLAKLHITRGELDSAEKMARLALSQTDAIQTPELRASVMLNLADVLWLRGDVDAAERLFSEIVEGGLEGGEPNLATALTGLGIVHWVRGELEAAETHYRQALSLRRNLYGRMHADVASGMDNLAIVLKDQKRFAEAEGLYKDALAIRQRIFGDNDIDVARSHNNYGELLLDMGHVEQAAAQYQAALDIQRSSVGERHFATGGVMLNLARTYLELGREDDGFRLYRTGVDIIEETLGAEHLHAGYGHRIGAELSDRQGHHDKAIELAQRAVAILADSLPHDHPDVIEAKMYAEQLVNSLRGDAREAAVKVREKGSSLTAEETSGSKTS